MSLNSQQQFSFAEWLKEGGQPGQRNSIMSSYARVAWVYSCINTIATVASSAPLAFYKDISMTESSRIRNPKADVVKLFNPPKPPFIPSLRELIYRTFVHLGIQGKVFWVFKKTGSIYNEIDLRYNLVAILSKGDSGRLIGWKEETPLGTVKYNVEQVLPIVYYNPSDLMSNVVPVTGLSPLSAARISLEQENNINGWNTAFFKSGMKNPILIKSKGTLTKDQKKEIRQEVSQYYSGTDGAHGALLLSGNLETEQLSISKKDIDFIEGKKLNREEICSIFGVPPALVGIFEYANFSNTREQRKIFWENTLLPKMAMILELVQINILDPHFPNIFAKWDTSNIYGLKPDAADVANAAKVYYEMGISVKDLATILKLPELANVKIEKNRVNPAPSPGGNNNKPIPQANRRPDPSKPTDNPGDPSNVQNEPKKDFIFAVQNVLKHYVTSVKSAKTVKSDLNTRMWIDTFFGLVRVDLEKYCKESNLSLKLATETCERFATMILDEKLSSEVILSCPDKFATVLADAISSSVF